MAQRAQAKGNRPPPSSSSSLTITSCFQMPGSPNKAKEKFTRSLETLDHCCRLPSPARPQMCQLPSLLSRCCRAHRNRRSRPLPMLTSIQLPSFNHLPSLPVTFLTIPLPPPKTFHFLLFSTVPKSTVKLRHLFSRFPPQLSDGGCPGGPQCPRSPWPEAIIVIHFSQKFL